MGLGCAGIFTGAFYVLTQWLPTDRVVTQIGGLNSFAALGSLCATTPFAVLIAWIGWRDSYWIFTAGVTVLLLAVAIRPARRPIGPAATFLQARRTGTGVRRRADAIRQPGMKRLLVAGLPMSSASTIAGVWGAPYLRDVHALDDIGRGNVLLAMAACAMPGTFLYGQLARRLNTIKGMILAGSAGHPRRHGTLAALERPPLSLVMGLFCLIALSAAYPTLTHAHARGLVPTHLVGRGVSLTNMGVMTAGGVHAAGVRLDRRRLRADGGRATRARLSRRVRRPGRRRAVGDRNLCADPRCAGRAG